MSDRLAASGGGLIDAQWDGPLLRSLGAEPMPRERYLRLLDRPPETLSLPTGREPGRPPASRLATVTAGRPS